MNNQENVGEFAVKVLKQYALENQIPARSTSDLSPFEQWLILRLHAAKSFDSADETSEQFVTRMLTGLTPKTLRYYPNSVFYVDSNDRCILEIEKKYAWVRYFDFWGVLRNKFNLEWNDIQNLIKPILEQTLKVKGVTPSPDKASFGTALEQTLKVKGVTPTPATVPSEGVLEQTLKVKGVTPTLQELPRISQFEQTLKVKGVTSYCG